MNDFSDTHIIISALGSRGDIHPFLAIAIEFKNRGSSNITFLVNDYYHDLVVEHGFKHISIGTKENQIEFINDQRIWDTRYDVAALGWDRTIRPAIETAYKVVEDAHKSGDKVLVIGLQHIMNGALMAAEVFDLPSVNMTLSPQLVITHADLLPSTPIKHHSFDWLSKNIKQKFINRVRSISLKVVMEKDYFWQLNGMRRFRKLKPIKDFSTDTVLSKNSLQICLFPSWFGQPASNWPENLHLTGFPLFDEVKHEVHKDVEQFINEQGKPILFTFGTGVFDTDELFKVGLAACEALGYPGLFVGGEIDENFITSKKYMHIKYVDFESVFPKCLAVVHHGGIGTLAQAIQAGVPQLIRPQAFDQFDNADRVHNLGLGSFVLRKNFNVRNIARTLNIIMKSQTIKEQIKHCASVMRSSNPIERVCDLIEYFAAMPKSSRCNPFKKAISEFMQQTLTHKILIYHY